MSFEWDADKSADIIDIRDVIERFEELESELEAAHEEGEFMSDFDDWLLNSRDNSNQIHAFFGERGPEIQSAIEEFYKIRALLEELKGYGADEQWRGDWYPVILIRDSYIQEYAQSYADDCGLITKNAGWPNNCIDWEAATEEFKQDYSTVDIDGTDYYYRD
jgi:hypothetical protein